MVVDLRYWVRQYKKFWGLDRVDRSTVEQMAFFIISMVVFALLCFFGMVCLFTVLRVMIRLI